MLILASLATFMQMMRKIRESKLQIESAIFWMILAMVLVVFSVFPPVADFIAHCLGIYSTANFLFLFAIFLLIMKEFRMTIHISQLETRVKELVQRMALEEKLREEHEEQRNREEQKARGRAEEPRRAENLGGAEEPGDWAEGKE